MATAQRVPAPDPVLFVPTAQPAVQRLGLLHVANELVELLRSAHTRNAHC